MRILLGDDFTNSINTRWRAVQYQKANTLIKAPFWQVFFWLLAPCLLTACSSPAVYSPPAAVQALPEYTPTPADVFIVDAWVSNPEPHATETVIIIGTIQRNGLYLGGIMMNAYWPDEDNPRYMPNCTVQVLYQRGVCSTFAGKYPPGVYVPIQVSFEFGGKTYTGETGFTPK